MNTVTIKLGKDEAERLVGYLNLVKDLMIRSEFVKRKEHSLLRMIKYIEKQL